ncbi:MULTISPECIES: glycosyl hydrolase [unclassified Marinimicrobium]|uniref:glycosyl hydrolase n=3 Tax=Marinimicrobium TaxID=359337 RepID=UPI00257AA65D|nr:MULTISPECIES: glycosyl hydrolase [unclassified Marinimicrobium]
MNRRLLGFGILFFATSVTAQNYPPPSTTPTESAVSVGAGSYLSEWDSRVDAAIPDNRDVQQTQHITSNLEGQPIPTNDWWSSLVWAGVNEPWLDWGTRGSHNVSYAHPFALKAQRNGMRLYSPNKSDYWTADYAFVGAMPDPVEEWVDGTPTPLFDTVYFKDLDFVLGNSAADDNLNAKVHDFSDWFVTTRMEAPGASMDLTFGHGSPYVFAHYETGNPTLEFSTDSTAPDAAVAQVWAGSENTPVLGFTVEGRHYAAFAPEGTSWEGLGTATITANLPQTDRYFSVAALPDPDALALFERYAYNHVTHSEVSWDYRQNESAVVTTYQVETENHVESEAPGTLFGLYPHQWRKLADGVTFTGDAYYTPRGDMKLAEGNGFTTRARFQGVIPELPRLESEADLERLSGLVESVRRETFTHRDTYYTGKRLGKLATLVPLARQSGNTDAGEQFLDELKWRLEGWLKADVIDDLEPSPFAKNLFYYNDHWGTMLGIDASFGSIDQLNDHHFHYGYFVRAAAEIARVEPEWASPAQFGGMVELLIRDYANWERPGQSSTPEGAMFPFLRNFDIYAGHSWASGHSRFGAGNNNESSSEAMNAWTAMILWGELTGNTAMRDAGIYLYTTEKTAIQEYWNDVYEENLHEDFTKPMASLIWGGKTDYATWFSARPEAMHGIILLPIQSGSLYLGEYPDNVKANYEFLENSVDQFVQWDAIFYAFQAAYDPDGALANFNANEGLMASSVSGPAARTEVGNSLANTFSWIKTFDQYGRIDRGVYSTNHPTVAVFNDGDLRTYVVYNADLSNAKDVMFNDGVVVPVGPGELVVQQAVIPDSNVPEAPELNRVAAENSALRVNFSPVDGATEYQVAYGEVGQPHTAIMAAGDATDYALTNLQNGTEYYIQIRATNHFGDGAWSEAQYATPGSGGSGSSQSSSSSDSSSSDSSSSSSHSQSSSSSSHSQSSSSSTSSSARSSDASSSTPPMPETGEIQITSLSDGAVRFSLRLDEEKNQVHLFTRRNGLQDYVVIDLHAQAGGVADNGDGTFTYSAIRDGAYSIGDQVEARFYTYTPDSGQVFYPGPTDNVWALASYEPGAASSSSSSSSASDVSSSSSPSSSSSSSSVAYSDEAVLPNGAPVEYTTSARYEGGDVIITFTTEEALNWAWCFTPGWNEMTAVDDGHYEVRIPDQTPGTTLTYYFTVSTATRGEGNNNNEPHRFVIE